MYDCLSDRLEWFSRLVINGWKVFREVTYELLLFFMWNCTGLFRRSPRLNEVNNHIGTHQESLVMQFFWRQLFLGCNLHVLVDCDDIWHCLGHHMCHFFLVLDYLSLVLGAFFFGGHLTHQSFQAKTITRTRMIGWVKIKGRGLDFVHCRRLLTLKSWLRTKRSHWSPTWKQAKKIIQRSFGRAGQKALQSLV